MLKDLWARAPRWAVYAVACSLAVVVVATFLGGLDLAAVWVRFVQLNVAVLAMAFFLVAVRLMNSVSGNSFDANFAAAEKSPEGLRGIMEYYGLRIVALGLFLGQVWRY